MLIERSLGIEYVFPDTVSTLQHVPSGPCFAIIQCALLVDSNGKGNVAVRFTDDGTTPSSDVGFELSPGQTYKTVCSVDALQFIGVANDARLNVKYEPFPSALNRIY